MGGRHWCIGTGQDQRQALGIVPVCLDMDERGFDDAGPAALGTPAHRAGQIAEREEPFVIGPREPLRRNPPDPCPARHINLVTAARIAVGIENLHIHGKTSMTGGREPLSRPSTRHGEARQTLTLTCHVARRASGQRDCAEQETAP
jgi:hypothetical protein